MIPPARYPGDVAAGETARRVVEDVRRRGAVLEAAARRARRGRDDEAIHDVRVAARRLGAALDLWRPLFPSRARRRVARGIRRLRRRAGRARQDEALVTTLGDLLAARSPAARRAAAPLFGRLELRAARGRGRVSSLVRRRRIAGLLACLEEALTGFAARAAGRPSWTDEALARVERRAAAARDRLASALASGGDEELHQARLALKKWRYVEECAVAAEIRPAGGNADPERLHELQEALGGIHEALLLRDLLAREAARRTAAGRPAAARQLNALAAALQARKLAAVRDLRRLATTTPAVAGPA